MTIDGHTEIAFTEDVCRRFDAYGWHTQVVEDANDVDAIAAAIENGIAETGRPSLIRVRSHIGYGSPHRQDTPAAHGKALGVEEVKLTKQFYGWPTEPDFYVPDEALAEFRQCDSSGARSLSPAGTRNSKSGQRPTPPTPPSWNAMLEGELPTGLGQGSSRVHSEGLACDTGIRLAG